MRYIPSTLPYQPSTYLRPHKLSLPNYVQDAVLGATRRNKEELGKSLKKLIKQD